MAAPKKLSSIKISEVDSLKEFNLHSIPYTHSGADEIKMYCPVHDDKNPSVTYNTAKNIWKCQSASCNATGDVISILAKHRVETRMVVIDYLSEKYDIITKRVINPEVIDQYHSKVFDCELIQKLRDRGLTDDLIRSARLGFNNGRITIPIRDSKGAIIDCRRYLPGAPGSEKMRNTPGYGGNNLYQIEQMRFQTVWLLGGEMKALLVGGMLNKHGIGAVSATTGEGNWDPSWNKHFKDKIVFICYDIDKGGLAGQRKVATQICQYAQSVRIISLPLDRVKYPKGDVNDFVGQEHKNDNDLLGLMRTAELFKTPEQVQDEDDDLAEPVEVILSDSTRAALSGKNIQTKAVVTSMDTEPYLIPKEILVSCTKDQECCIFCSIKTKESNDEGKMKGIVKSSSVSIVDMVASPLSKQNPAIKDALGIPPACKVCSFETASHYNVFDCRLTPQLHIGQESAKNIIQSAFVVTSELEMNNPYIFKGKVHPNPKNQHAVLVLNDVKTSDDSLSAFDPSAEDLKELEIFRPTDDSVEALDKKLEEIYADLSANVTRIYRRPELHLGVDLSFHSPLNIIFDGQEKSGWTNILIMGDSALGKSETSEKLHSHYGLGEIVSCKNASVAGLLGGLHQIGSRWFVSWGVIPTNDRGLVVLEEMKGANPEILAKLTDMRSTGIAEIPKIEKRKALARTRLLMISNPVSESMESYSFGVEAVTRLIPGPEDVRRLDMALIVSSKQIDSKEINKLQRNREQVPHHYTKTICQRLVLWAWSLKSEEVQFTDEATILCLDLATKLSEKYSDAVPLCDRGTMRFKLARLAASLAARVYSSEDGILIVKSCHIEYVYKFIDRTYSDPVFGYADFSSAQRSLNQISDPQEIRRCILATKFAIDFINSLLYTEEIELSDIADWCGTDRDGAQMILSTLVRKRALSRFKRSYFKNPEFIRLLKEMQSDPSKSKSDKSKFESAEEF